MFKRFSKLIVLSSLLLGLFGLVDSAILTRAASISAGVLDINFAGAPGPLFNATNIAPGYSETKSLIVTNTGRVSHSFSIAVSGELGTLADVLTIEPKILGSTVWSKTIAEIAKNPNSDIIIGSIAPGGSATVDLTAKLATSVGNDFQGKSTMAFSFVMGNESTDQSEPPADTSRQLSTALQPGISGVTSTLISPEATPETPPTDQGQVKGDESNGTAAGVSTSDKINCFWWWLLLILLLIVTGICAYFDPKEKKVVIRAIPLFFAAILYPVHWILHSYYTPVKMCDYFVWLELITLVLYYGFLYYKENFRKPPETTL